MRILLVSTAAIALSGCSMLGFGSSGHSYGPSSYGHGYAPQTSYNPCKAKKMPKPQGCMVMSQWNLEGAVGQEYMVGGDFTTPGDVTPIVGTDLNAVSMQDTYDPGLRLELGISKALNPNRKFTLMGSYTKAEGQDVNIASQTGVPANQIRGQASDYESYGIEAGLRQYFNPTAAPLFGSLRPYVEGRVGAANIDDISLTNARLVGGAPGVFNGGNIDMYEGGWVATGAGLVGVEAPIFKRATLGLETGIRYRGALDADQTDLSAAGTQPLLTGLNNGSENWSVPVTLRARYRF